MYDAWAQSTYVHTIRGYISFSFHGNKELVHFPFHLHQSHWALCFNDREPKKNLFLHHSLLMLLLSWNSRERERENKREELTTTIITVELKRHTRKEFEIVIFHSWCGDFTVKIKETISKNKTSVELEIENPRSKKPYIKSIEISLIAIIKRSTFHATLAILIRSVTFWKKENNFINGFLYKKKRNVANGDAGRAENKLECQRTELKIESSNQHGLIFFAGNQIIIIESDPKRWTLVLNLTFPFTRYINGIRMNRVEMVEQRQNTEQQYMWEFFCCCCWINS